jgi:DNA-binding PadR family transcriptional regulator
MRRPVPVDSLIMLLLRERGEMWYSDIMQALKAWYPDITEKEVLRALMKLELSKLIIVQRATRKEGPTYHVRLVKE